MKHPGGVVIVEEYLYEDGNVREYSRRKPGNLVYIMDNAPGSLHKWKSNKRRRGYDDFDFCVNPADEEGRKYNPFKGKFPLEHLEPPYDLSEE